MTFFGPDIRNGLPIGLGSMAGFGRRAFTPSVLFAAGEQGFWYDPSDLSSMFQDSAGTTPVTAVEQAVGLILDKSKGLVIGPELVTNGGMTVNLTGWTAVNDAGATAVAGASGVTLTSSGANVARLRQAPATTAGKFYQVSFTLVSGTFQFDVWGTGYGSGSLVQQLNYSTVGVKTYIVAATGANLYLQLSSVNSLAGVVTGVSVRELAGNHAIQPGATNRPILRSRYNLLTYSEQFDNAAWTLSRVTVSANSTVAPDGTSTADKMVATAVAGTHREFQSVTKPAVTRPYTFSCYVKAAEYGFAMVRLTDSTETDSASCCVNLATGEILVGASGFTGQSGAAVSVGNGWWRASITATTDAETVVTAMVFIQTSLSTSGSSFTGNGSDGLFVWGADLRDSNDTYLPAYQRIAAATDYDTVGFPVYLAFDGSDDSLYTGGNVDFSATDKMTVFAGVTKLSDATWGAVAEISAVPGSNNGTFGMFAPYDNTNQNYGASSRGTINVFISGAASGAGSVPAPSTDVATLQADIAAPSVALRLNGAAYVSSASSQGTGNFGSYPLYIGRRNNASNPFNGRIYSLIGRGAATSAALLTQAERWVAGKQGRSL